MPSTVVNHAHSQQQAKGSNSKQRNEHFVPVYVLTAGLLISSKQNLIISANLDGKCEQRQKKILTKTTTGLAVFQQRKQKM